MNCRYSMLIQWSDVDQAYVVTLPEFPRCRTHGATYEEAARSGQEVLELLAETMVADGRPLPEPATLDAAEELWRVLEAADTPANALSESAA
jgi:antitoxin HicB